MRKEKEGGREQGRERESKRGRQMIFHSESCNYSVCVGDGAGGGTRM